MGIVSWGVVGILAGLIAAKYFKNKGSALISNLVTGLIGGMIGGYLAMTALHIADAMTKISVVALILALVGGLFVTVLSRLVGQARDKALTA